MIDWIMDNKGDLWTAITTAVTLASIIVKLTPTEWDDKIWMKALNFIAITKKWKSK